MRYPCRLFMHPPSVSKSHSILTLKCFNIQPAATLLQRMRVEFVGCNEAFPRVIAVCDLQFRVDVLSSPVALDINA